MVVSIKYTFNWSRSVCHIYYLSVTKLFCPVTPCNILVPFTKLKKCKTSEEHLTERWNDYTYTIPLTKINSFYSKLLNCTEFFFWTASEYVIVWLKVSFFSSIKSYWKSFQKKYCKFLIPRDEFSIPLCKKEAALNASFPSRLSSSSSSLL